MTLDTARHHGEAMVSLIRDLWLQKFDMPAVILAYSTIDAFASLARPVRVLLDTSEPEDFKGWVKEYLLPNGELLDVTPDELWEARNGVLHTYGPETRAIKKRGVRRIGYHTGAGIVWPAESPFFPEARVAPHLLLEALERAIPAFLARVESDKALCPLVEERVGRELFVLWVSKEEGGTPEVF